MVHKILKLQHHRHTAKRLPHHHTSYPALLFVLVLCGMVLYFVQRTNAVNLTVTAKISAPLPSGAAVITNPNDGAQFFAPQIEVSGTCPVIVPSIIVTLWSGSTLLGSAVCSPTGTFSALITLAKGWNEIVPRILNITDDYGATGLKITVAYQPPTIYPNTTQTERPPIEALLLRSNQAAITYTPGAPFELILSIGKGEPPYTLLIDWGDGNKESWPVNTAGDIAFEHVYTTKLPLRIVINAIDNRTQTAQISIGAISFAQQYGGASDSGNGEQASGIGIISKNTFGVAWLSYTLAVLVAGYFWVLHGRRTTVLPVSVKSRAGSSRKVAPARKKTRRS